MKADDVGPGSLRGRRVAKVKSVMKARPTKTDKRPSSPWMHALAQLAATSRADGGAGLQHLLYCAKFNVKPRLSLTKHTADDVDWSLTHRAA
jgi:hypothetical protein